MKAMKILNVTSTVIYSGEDIRLRIFDRLNGNNLIAWQ